MGRLLEVFEKGIRNPEPYRSVYASFEKAYPSVELPPFSSLSGALFESSPFQIALQRLRFRFVYNHPIGVGLKDL